MFAMELSFRVRNNELQNENELKIIYLNINEVFCVYVCTFLW